MKIENSIDIVITWVDGNDPEWRSEKNKNNKAVAYTTYYSFKLSLYKVSYK